MRPCRQCRGPIENNVAVCPQCSAAQDDPPKPTGPVPPPVLRRRLFHRSPPAPAPTNPDSPAPRRPNLAQRVLLALFHLPAVEPLVLFLFLLVLAFGGAVGYKLAEQIGAIVGVVVALVVVVIFLAWDESGADGT